MIKFIHFLRIQKEAKYELLINKRDGVSLIEHNDSKTFIEYSNNEDDIYKNIEKCNPN